MIGEVTNHLWQSTLFAAVPALLAIALRRNRAQVRYWLWFSASFKFFLPFSLLMSLGHGLGWAPAARKAAIQIVAPAVSFTIERISQPFSNTPPLASAALGSVDWLGVCVLGFWACGFVAIALRRFRDWLCIRAAILRSIPIDVAAPITVRASPGLLEPGVAGLFRPVLLLPAGIVERLTPSQFRAVLAHEICHARRRDNLFASIHMAVEAIFWFHPLVWFIGARLVEERERACDEAVLKLGSDPRVYAEAIVNVCRLYVESPLICVSGITGFDIKKRIEAIMINRTAVKLSFAKKVTLLAAGMAALSVPIVVGMMNATPIRAQSQSSKPLAFEVASVKQLPPGKDFPLPARYSTAPHRSGDRISWVTGPGGIVRYAYNLQQWRISGTLPSDSFYEIDAKTVASTTDDQLRLMFQTLLVERFKLAAHYETKELNGYALVVGKKGPKIKEFRDQDKAAPLPDWFRDKGEEFSNALEGRCMISMEGQMSALTGRRVSMLRLAEALQDKLGVFVLDKTGMPGNYYFGILFQREGRARNTDDSFPGPDVFAAVQEELGLKLEKQSGPVEILVVDHMEKAPTEN